MTAELGMAVIAFVALTCMLSGFAHGALGFGFPLVVDPVMLATSGARLLRQDAVEALVSRLFPRATVITPNLPEAEALTGRRGNRRDLAECLHAMGAPAVLVTAGRSPWEHARPAVKVAAP